MNPPVQRWAPFTPGATVAQILLIPGERDDWGKSPRIGLETPLPRRLHLHLELESSDSYPKAWTGYIFLILFIYLAVLGLSCGTWDL